MFSYMVIHYNEIYAHFFMHPCKDLDTAVKLFNDTKDHLQSVDTCVRDESNPSEEYYRATAFDQSGDVCETVEIKKLVDDWM